MLENVQNYNMNEPISVHRPLYTNTRFFKIGIDFWLFEDSLNFAQSRSLFSHLPRGNLPTQCVQNREAESNCEYISEEIKQIALFKEG